MDMRTGKIYDSVEEAIADGADERNVIKVSKDLREKLNNIPLRFPKNPFGSIKNKVKESC